MFFFLQIGIVVLDIYSYCTFLILILNDIIKVKREMFFKMKDAKEMTAGTRVMQLRMEKRYTREQFADMAGISEKFLYEIENDKKGFSAATLVKLSKALNVSMEYIMTGDDYKRPESEIVATLERLKPNTLEKVERLLKIAYELAKDGK